MSERITTALADCAEHYVALPVNQMKRKSSDWNCPYCRIDAGLKLADEWSMAAHSMPHTEDMLLTLNHAGELREALGEEARDE